MQEFTEDDKLAELMRKSIVKMPFSDFEDEMMGRIEVEVQNKKSILKNINLSLLFFLFGAIVGTGICLFLPEILSTVSGVSSDKTLLIFQAIFVLTVLIQLDKLVQLVRKYGST